MPQNAARAQSSTPAPTAQGATVVLGDRVVQIPQTANELKGLRQQRSEISSQIQNVTSRRNDIAEQLLSADPAVRAGLAERLKVLDNRILQLERELDVTGEALRRAQPVLAAQAADPSPADMFRQVSSDIVPIVAILSVFVLGPMSIALSRFIWRRAAAPSRQQQAVDSAQQQRLDQLQSAVDTIAIEVERISENQRFVTKMLSDGRQRSSEPAERS